MIFTEGIDQYYAYLEGKKYEYFKISGDQSGEKTIMLIGPAIVFAPYGRNFYLKKILIQSIMIESENIIANKAISGY